MVLKRVGGDRAAEQESYKRASAAMLYLEWLTAKLHILPWITYLCLRCTPSEQKPPPISKDSATQFKDTPKLTSARALFRKWNKSKKKREEEEKISNSQGHPVQEAGASSKREERREVWPYRPTSTLKQHADHSYGTAPQMNGLIEKAALRTTQQQLTKTVAPLRAFIPLVCKHGHQQTISCQHLSPTLQGYVERSRICA